MSRLGLAAAAMVMSLDCPGVHEVPAASGWTTDQVPLAHCWKELPLMQFHIPSVEQDPVRASPEPELELPVLTGAEGVEGVEG
jgi:hypothetical protein